MTTISLELAVGLAGLGAHIPSFEHSKNTDNTPALASHARSRPTYNDHTHRPKSKRKPQMNLSAWFGTAANIGELDDPSVRRS